MADGTSAEDVWSDAIAVTIAHCSVLSLMLTKSLLFLLLQPPSIVARHSGIIMTSFEREDYQRRANSDGRNTHRNNSLIALATLQHDHSGLPASHFQSQQRRYSAGAVLHSTPSMSPPPRNFLALPSTTAGPRQDSGTTGVLPSDLFVDPISPISSQVIQVMPPNSTSSTNAYHKHHHSSMEASHYNLARRYSLNSMHSPGQQHGVSAKGHQRLQSHASQPHSTKHLNSSHGTAATGAPKKKLIRIHGRFHLWVSGVIIWLALCFQIQGLVTESWIEVDSSEHRSVKGKDLLQWVLVSIAVLLGLIAHAMLVARFFGWRLADRPTVPFKITIIFLLICNVVCVFIATQKFVSLGEFTQTHPLSGDEALQGYILGASYHLMEISGYYMALCVVLLGYHEIDEQIQRARLEREKRKKVRLRQEKQQNGLSVRNVHASSNGSSTALTQKAASSPKSSNSGSGDSGDLEKNDRNSGSANEEFAQEKEDEHTKKEVVVQAEKQSEHQPIPPYKPFGVVLHHDYLSPPQRRFVFAVNLFFLILYGGGLMFGFIEGWNIRVANDFCIVTLATIGYGNVTPKSIAGRIVLFIYFPLGFALLGFAVNLVWQVVLAKLNSRVRKYSSMLSQHLPKRLSWIHSILGQVAKPPVHPPAPQQKSHHNTAGATKDEMESTGKSPQPKGMKLSENELVVGANGKPLESAPQGTGGQQSQKSNSPGPERDHSTSKSTGEGPYQHENHNLLSSTHQKTANSAAAMQKATNGANQAGKSTDPKSKPITALPPPPPYKHSPSNSSKHSSQESEEPPMNLFELQDEIQFRDEREKERMEHASGGHANLAMSAPLSTRRLHASSVDSNNAFSSLHGHDWTATEGHQQNFAPRHVSGLSMTGAAGTSVGRWFLCRPLPCLQLFQTRCTKHVRTDLLERWAISAALAL